MSELLRQELHQLFAIDDQLRADFAQWEAKRAPMVQKQHAGELVYKTTITPRPQPSAATMDAEQQRGWDTWVRAHIKNALAEQPLFSEEQVDVIAETISLFREELHKHIATELGQLRADIEILRSIVAGKTGEIGRKDVA